MSRASPPPHTPVNQRGNPYDDLSDSDTSQVTLQRRSPLPPASVRSVKPPPSAETVAQAPLNYSRPTLVAPQQSHESPRRSEDNAIQRELGARLGHRPRQRSQGYFEPNLPSSQTTIPTMSTVQNPLDASRIAAQAAMQNPMHNRKRSTTVPEQGTAGQPGQKQPISPPPVPGSHTVTFRTNGMTYANGIAGDRGLAARTAANVVFPKSPLVSPGVPPGQEHGSSKIPQSFEAPQKPIKESKSKMKLFSKPKNIKLDGEKAEKKSRELPSPGKMGIGIHTSTALNRMMMNQSTTSLADSSNSNNPSVYSSANASTSTLVPAIPEKEKEKHKHHFLMSRKNKSKEKDDHALPLSSASSTSRPTDPSAPQPLYSFAVPSSPGHTSSFANSVTGLDLRHGGRHLRQKKKEEKAAAYLDATLDPPFRERNQSFSGERSEWPALALEPTTPSNLSSSPATSLGYTGDMAKMGQAFGISGILTPDDAWPLLKARLLHIFEGEDPRPPVEDFNALVLIHIKRCIQKRSPIIVIEDLNELLSTGFSSLDQTLRHVPDDRLIPHLVEMWLVVFTTILPFLQAVFLPLDLEFKGRGIMNSTAAADFWGVLLPDEMNTKSPENKNLPMLGELDVRRIILLVFRDTVILPRFETLMAIFSRLSLENLNAGLESTSVMPSNDNNIPVRPGTAGHGSSSHEHGNSLQSTSHGSSSAGFLESTVSSSTFADSGRSRATSNTSAGSFSTRSLHSNSNPPLPVSTLHTITSASNLHPLAPSLSNQTNQSSYTNQSQNTSVPSQFRPQPLSSAKVTETVGRMLQCVSVLVSLQSSDEAQEKMGKMNKELKYNWLGRGRTGRQRRGFVGPRRGGGILNVPGVGVDVLREEEGVGA